MTQKLVDGELVDLTAEDIAELEALRAAAESASALPVPASISDRQFFQQLAIDGDITQAEALAAVKTGEMPAAIQVIINSLPASQRFGAQMLLSGATVFERAHPLAPVIGAGRTDAQIDDFYRAAALL